MKASVAVVVAHAPAQDEQQKSQSGLVNAFPRVRFRMESRKTIMRGQAFYVINPGGVDRLSTQNRQTVVVEPSDRLGARFAQGQIIIIPMASVKGPLGVGEPRTESTTLEEG